MLEDSWQSDRDQPANALLANEIVTGDRQLMTWKPSMSDFRRSSLPDRAEGVAINYTSGSTGEPKLLRPTG